MKNMKHALLLPCLLLGALGVHAAVGASSAARLVPAQIEVNGEVVLRASTSDDGHPDADAVWDYLNSELFFEPTEAFEALGIAEDARSHTLGFLKSKDNETLGEPPTLALDVSYGGRAEPRILELVRTDSGKWKVHPETVERQFNYRWIRRWDAARLKRPKRDK